MTHVETAERPGFDPIRIASKLPSFAFAWIGAVAAIDFVVSGYALADSTVDYVLNADGGPDDAQRAAEWARRAPLLEQLIFGPYGGGEPPDPEDDDGFRELLERIVKYGLVAPGAICAALGVAPSAVSRWLNRKGDGSLPIRYARRSIIEQVLRLMVFKDKD